MIIARDLHYREARLRKMRQLRNKMEAERMLLDEGASFIEKVQVNAFICNTQQQQQQ